jgi:hypothetical protein
MLRSFVRMISTMFCMNDYSFISLKLYTISRHTFLVSASQFYAWVILHLLNKCMHDYVYLLNKLMHYYAMTLNVYNLRETKIIHAEHWQYLPYDCRSIVLLGIKRNALVRSIERLWSTVHKITRAYKRVAFSKAESLTLLGRKQAIDRVYKTALYAFGRSKNKPWCHSLKLESKMAAAQQLSNMTTGSDFYPR